MKLKWFIFGFLAGIVVTVITVAGILLFAANKYVQSHTVSQIPDSAYAECPNDGDANIIRLLEPIRKKHKVPAICAAVVTSEGLKFAGAVGVRKIGTDIPVTLNDKWHLGSDTKAMTASVIGRLVEQGAVSWTSTLAEIFPELESSINPELKNVTVLQLLSHRAGLTADLDWPELSKKGSLQEQRYAVVKKAIADKPEYKPGSKFSYSNLGYVIAGAIIEKVTNSSWEEQIKNLLFEPLKMITAGFGGTGTSGQIDQPWGHNANGTPVAKNGMDIDNPLLMASAGCVNCSMADWSKFVIDQLKGAIEKPALLKPQTYKTIQTPPFGGDYALGWIVTKRDWGGGTVFNHCGSNTMNFANVWIAPNRDFAILVCINQGGDEGFNASDEVVSELINFYFKNK
ncbi:MAG: serine hydrolase domain-containing protein [Phycisphaerae bacterium]|jgi:CubicO group peptidase (beta-lactamase class C family)